MRPEALTPGTLVEHWRILQGLGQWGHGASYRVENVRQPGASLALRMSLREAEGQFEDRTARLNATHPNVVRLHACGRWPRPKGAFFYCVRDFVKGQRLPSWVRTVNPTFLQATALMRRLAFALDDMHERDTWHREIHPANIRVRDEDGEPVLLDLRPGGNEGVDTLTQDPLPLETLVFRSPEALRFLRMNWGRKGVRYPFRHTDDLYALGATAYWLVTGHPPFSLSLPAEQLLSQMELRMPPPPWEVNPRVPRTLGTVILWLLDKRPEVRPRSGEMLNAELAVVTSAGSRSVWAARIFDWACEPGGAPISPRRIQRPLPPLPAAVPGPRLPRVVHFSPLTERAAAPAAPVPREECTPPLAPGLRIPWPRLM